MRGWLGVEALADQTPVSLTATWALCQKPLNTVEEPPLPTYTCGAGKGVNEPSPRSAGRQGRNPRLLLAGLLWCVWDCFVGGAQQRLAL